MTTGLAPVQPYRRLIAGRLCDFTSGGGWVEVVGAAQADTTAAVTDDIEGLMRGRTEPEAETGRQLLRERKVRRARHQVEAPFGVGPQTFTEDGRLVGSQPRTPRAVQVIWGGVTAT